MNGWPAFDVLTTQDAYWEWLKRAHDHGLQLMVMLAVNNSVLCHLAYTWFVRVRRRRLGRPPDPGRQGPPDLHRWRRRRTRQGFYRIVYSADEARQAIEDGKLAVVLGTEVDTAWGCTVGALLRRKGGAAIGPEVLQCRHSRRLPGAPRRQRLWWERGLQRPFRARTAFFVTASSSTS